MLFNEIRSTYKLNYISNRNTVIQHVHYIDFQQINEIDNVTVEQNRHSLAINKLVKTLSLVLVSRIFF